MKPAKKRKSAKFIPNSSDSPRLHAQIESRAYDLWLAEGRREGNDVAHWLQAERELLSARQQPSAD